MKTKMMRVIISFLILLTLFLPVSAKSYTNKWSEKVELYQSKRTEIQNIRSNINEKITSIRENKLDNQLIWSENSNLRAQVKLKLIEIRESKIAISDETLNKIKDLNEDLKNNYQDLYQTNGDIHELTIQINDLVKSKDKEGLNSLYNQIIDIQLYRNELLSRINSILTEILDLVD